MVNRLFIAIQCILIAALSFLCGMLYFEYNHFANHVEEIIALEQDYQVYMMNMQKIVNTALLADSSSDAEPEQVAVDALTNQKNVEQSLPVSVPVIKQAPQKIQHKKRDIKRDFICSWPIEKGKFWLSSFFGPRRKPNKSWGYHYGIDMAALKGTPVQAAAAGKVVEAGYSAGYGKTIVIEHSTKYRTRYAHLDKIRVKKNQMVKPLQLIGNVGATGYIRKKGNDGSHLHFEVIQNNKQVNPLDSLV